MVRHCARPKARQSRLAVLLALPLVAGSCAISLGGCADETPPPVYTAPDYAYLGQIHLNVSQIDIVDLAPPGTTPGDISQQAPTPPDQALRTLAQERLSAAGNTGHASFTITQASITRAPDDTLNGTLAVHIDILTNDNQHVGYAEATVSRTLHQNLDSDGAVRSALYALTSQMMQDMNVELEFQIRRSLKDWLTDAGGAPATGAITQETLTTPTVAAPSSPAPVMPANPSTSMPAPSVQGPDAIFPTGSATGSAPAVKSPMAGYLHLPGTRGTGASH